MWKHLLLAEFGGNMSGMTYDLTPNTDREWVHGRAAGLWFMTCNYSSRPLEIYPRAMGHGWTYAQ